MMGSGAVNLMGSGVFQVRGLIVLSGSFDLTIYRV